MSPCFSLWTYHRWNSLHFLDMGEYFLSHVREIFYYNLFKCIHRPFLFFFWSEVAQSCPTLCDPMDCSLPGSPSMRFSRQARVLEWVAISLSRGSSSETPCNSNTGLYDVLHIYETVLISFHSLFYSMEVIYTFLYSSSLIHSSVCYSDVDFSTLFISVIVLFIIVNLFFTSC